MNEPLEERLRQHLRAVDAAQVPAANAVSALAGAHQRRLARRRALASAGLVAVLLAAGVAVWRAGWNDSPRVTGASTPITSDVATVPVTVRGTDGGSTTTSIEQVVTSVITGAMPGRWSAIPPDPRGATYAAAAVWTGSEAVVVGGLDQAGNERDGVVAYDPAANSWRTVSTDPIPVLAPIVLWTGHEVLLIGWTKDVPHSAVVSLDPATGKWTNGPASPLPDKLWRADPWVWTGTEVLVSTGSAGSQARAVAYNPSTTSWRTLPDAPLLSRQDAVSVWSGSAWLLWGGTDDTQEFADGAAYDPILDAWRPLPKSSLSPRRFHGSAGVWTGAEMLVTAGAQGGDRATGNGEMALADGAAYDPVGDSWRSLRSGPAHPGFVAAWTGSLMVLAAKNGAFTYDPKADTWSEFDGSAIPHDSSALVWSGTAVLLPGSYDPSTGGAVFRP